MNNDQQQRNEQAFELLKELVIHLIWDSSINDLHLLAGEPVGTLRLNKDFDSLWMRMSALVKSEIEFNPLAKRTL